MGHRDLLVTHTISPSSADCRQLYPRVASAAPAASFKRASALQSHRLASSFRSAILDAPSPQSFETAAAERRRHRVKRMCGSSFQNTVSSWCMFVDWSMHNESELFRQPDRLSPLVGPPEPPRHRSHPGPHESCVYFGPNGDISIACGVVISCDRPHLCNPFSASPELLHRQELLRVCVGSMSAACFLADFTEGCHSPIRMS